MFARSIVANESIKAGVVVVEVPDDVVLMAENCSIAEQLESEHGNKSQLWCCKHSGILSRGGGMSNVVGMKATMTLVHTCSIPHMSYTPAVIGWGLCKPAEDPILEVQGIIIALMYEKGLRSKSRWSPYIDFMPDDTSHLPMYWAVGPAATITGGRAPPWKILPHLLGSLLPPVQALAVLPNTHNLCVITSGR